MLSTINFPSAHCQILTGLQKVHLERKEGLQLAMKAPRLLKFPYTLAERLSYLNAPRPFKNPNYTKNVNRRAKNLKAVLGQERERERQERERRRQQKEQEMDVDGEPHARNVAIEQDLPTYLSIEAPPSVLPPKHYCDITGLEAPYTDPVTGLRYHDKSIYELIKGLSTSAAKDHLSARGVNPIVK
ncbi:hypothetical protein EW146_g8079 [Bondarzewia mesenterica]|uniref:Vps72/YL1 C-terminal domain-containing protein n=1 Tax=Bondarzewia mesenterica TaxID=1095465 RepID=A0A4S4LHW5_9AGAM|nr:hypothetical protein EW146_g8079 [Bondarzewia mesenterica]